MTTHPSWGAALLLAVTGLWACQGPALTVTPAEPGATGARFLDGRQLPSAPSHRLPQPYYGTAVLDAFPVRGEGGGDEFQKVPARATVAMPEPVSPWWFPLDFPLECLLRLAEPPPEPVGTPILADNPAPAITDYPLAGAEELRRRALAARVRR